MQINIGRYQIPPTAIADRLIEYQLLPQFWQQLRLDEAIAKIECTNSEIAQATQKWLESRQINSSEQLQTLLQQQKLNQEQWLSTITRQLKIAKFQESTWGDQVEAFFLSHKAQLDRVVYSLIRSKDVALIQELYFRLIEEESTWAQLAQTHSSGIEAQTCGLVGPVELGRTNPIIAQHLRIAQANQVYGPIKLQDVFILLRLERFLPAVLDEAMRQRLLDQMMSQWLDGEWQKQN